MSCLEIRPVLSDFLEDNLDADRSELVRAHVRLCPDCGMELERLGTVSMLLLEWSPPRLPSSVWDRVLSELPQAERRKRPVPHAFRLAVATSAVLAMFALGWSVAIRPILDSSFEGTPAGQVGPAVLTFEGTAPAPIHSGNSPYSPGINDLGVPTRDLSPQDPPVGESRAVPPSKTPTDTRTSKEGQPIPQKVPEASPPENP